MACVKCTGGFRAAGHADMSPDMPRACILVAGPKLKLTKTELWNWSRPSWIWRWLRNENSAQRGSFWPDIPADIRPKTSVRPSKSWKISILERTSRADVHEKTSVWKTSGWFSVPQWCGLQELLCRVATSICLVRYWTNLWPLETGLSSMNQGALKRTHLSLKKQTEPKLQTFVDSPSIWRAREPQEAANARKKTTDIRRWGLHLCVRVCVCVCVCMCV